MAAEAEAEAKAEEVVLRSGEPPLAPPAAPTAALKESSRPAPPSRTGSAPRPFNLPRLAPPGPPQPPPPPPRGFPGSPAPTTLEDGGVLGGPLTTRPPPWWDGYGWGGCCVDRRLEKPTQQSGGRGVVLNVGFGGQPVASETFGTPLLTALLHQYEHLQQQWRRRGRQGDATTVTRLRPTPR